MITVDCGITAISQIKEVVSHKIDVIITDHHEPTEQIPYCVATLNPKLTTDTYPNRELTGVGVAFKLAHGLTNRLVSEGKITAKKVNLKHFLDLVAMGTISDMGSLRGENRILVHYGIEQLQHSKRIGLEKLVSVCGLELHDISPTDVGTKIAPRLNSLGRIADPTKGVELLLIKHAQKAEEMAVAFDLNNVERQKIERTMTVDMNSIIAKNTHILDNKAIIIESETWHPGVIAILSTRMSKQYNRPAVMIAIDQGIGKGSLRSVSQFPLLPVLKENADLLINFGGHDFAAGLTIKKENIEEFKKRFLNAANAKLAEQDVLPKLLLDADVQFKDLTFDFMESLRLLEPYGHGNTPPILFCNAKQAWPPKVVGKTHLKLYLEQEDRILEGIAFGMAARARSMRKKNLALRVAFTPQINTFQNKASIQLIVRDFNILTTSPASPPQ